MSKPKIPARSAARFMVPPVVMQRVATTINQLDNVVEQIGDKHDGTDTADEHFFYYALHYCCHATLLFITVNQRPSRH